MTFYPPLTKHVAENNLLATTANICTIIVVLLVLYSKVPVTVLIAWISFQVLVSGFRVFLGRKLLLVSEDNPQSQKILLQFSVILGLTGAGWGALSVIALIYTSLTEQLFFSAILIGFAGGAVATLSPIYKAFLAFLSGMLGTQGVVFIVGGVINETVEVSSLSFLAACVVFTYSLISAKAGRVMRDSMLKSTELNNALEESRLQSESANAAKTKFLSSISHELRTPLHAIMGFGQLLEIDEKLNPEQERNVGQITKASEHLLALIDQVLNFSKIEEGEFDLNVEKLEINALFQECEALVMVLGDSNRINISFYSSSEPSYLWSDSLKIKQVILNLVSNAVKYNKPEGCVTISFEEFKQDRIRILVKDSGLGIPLDRQPELFQSFNRLGRESSGPEGVGIGLVISKELTSHLGGEIGFESTEGEGSCFWIELAYDHFNKSSL